MDLTSINGITKIQLTSDEINTLASDGEVNFYDIIIQKAPKRKYAKLTCDCRNEELPVQDNEWLNYSQFCTGCGGKVDLEIIEK